MKLLFLTEFFPRDHKLIFTGGVEARAYYIATRARKDFEIKVISSRSQQIPATPFSIFNRIAYLFTSFFKAIRTDFDLIEGSNVVTYLPAFLAGKLKAKPTIAWIPDVLGKYWFDFGFVVGSFGFFLEKISLALPWTQIIALSQSTKDKLISHGIKSQKIAVARAGIDPQEFKIKTKKKFSQFTIISIARLVKTKRLDDLIKAFAELNSQLPQTRLVIIGQGPEKKNLQNLVNKLKLEGKTQFLANLSRKTLIKTLYQSHLFCLPSIVEGFGIATIEAMTAGLPVVLADIPINQEITQNGQGALFFQPNNSSHLAKKLVRLITHKSLYQQKRLQAQKLAKKYTWERIYQQTKKIYEDCHSS